MIKKISISLIVISLFIAIPLSIAGIKYVNLGDPWIAFMNNVTYAYSKIDFTIPSIPKIPEFNNPEWYWVLINALNFIVNFLIDIVNVLVFFINIIFTICEYIMAMIASLIALVEQLIRTGEVNNPWYIPYDPNLPIL